MTWLPATPTRHSDGRSPARRIHFGSCRRREGFRRGRGGGGIRERGAQGGAAAAAKGGAGGGRRLRGPPERGPGRPKGKQEAPEPPHASLTSFPTRSCQLTQRSRPIRRASVRRHSSARLRPLQPFSPLCRCDWCTAPQGPAPASDWLPALARRFRSPRARKGPPFCLFYWLSGRAQVDAIGFSRRNGEQKAAEGGRWTFIGSRRPANGQPPG